MISIEGHALRTVYSPLVLGALLVVAPSVEGQETFPPPLEPPVSQAVRARASIVVDGRLAEADWSEAPVVSGFRQVEPKQGEPATHDTEVRLLYDDRHVYVGARCIDPLGRAGLRVKNLRRDFDFSTDDVFGVSFDTFRDGQNALVFQVNSRGVARDLQVRDGDTQDLQWDAVWRVRTEIADDGWTVEMAIPWATLRYSPATHPSWGVNFVRVVRRLNETTGWSPWPRVYPPYRMSYAGVLQGLEPPPPSTNIRFQPYAVVRGNRGGVETQRTTLDAGGDLKWAIRPGTVLDATFNTDFAQADADRQVVNLTRFSVLFPEQRPFFLESASLFSAGQERNVRPFFSRRIGLDDAGIPITIDGGARLTHRTRRSSAGALLIRQEGTGGVNTTTFGVGRYVQNVGRESRVGGLLVTRIDDGIGAQTVTNTVAAIDSFLRLKPNVYVRAMLSGSTTTGAAGDGLAGTFDVTREANWGVLSWVSEYIGPRYRAGTGFVSRLDLIRSYPNVNLDLRPAWKPRFLRRFGFASAANVFHRASDGVFQEAQWFVPLPGLWFQGGGWLLTYVQPNWQRIDRPFAPLPGIRIAPGNYQYTRYVVSMSTDPSRRFSLRMDGEVGPFYDGQARSGTIALQANPDPRLYLQASYSVNALTDVGGAAGDKTTHLVQPLVRLALNPRVQLTAFYQHNTAAQLATWNARFSWEFWPLSYVYLVYNERRSVAGAAVRLATERQVIFKITVNKPL